MRTHQYANKKRASQSVRTPVSRPTEVQASVQPALIQAKSNEEGLAEHAERLRKFQRLGNSMMQMGPPRLDNDTTSSLQPQPWIQKKLTIGKPGDKYEQEADRVASQVAQHINAPTFKENSIRESIQREKDLEGAMCTRGFQAAIQRKQAMTNEETSPELESAINTARGSGQPLDAGLQQSMGQAMGANFSGVKVHTDTQSDQLNQSIQARAFTTGQDVFFRGGAYQPGNRGGQELIAHELTHVLQQDGGVVQRQSNCKIDELLQDQFATHSFTSRFQAHSVPGEEREKSAGTDAWRNEENKTGLLSVLSSSDIGTIQRDPVEDKDNKDFYDSVYTMVRMTKVSGKGYLSNTYKITSEGKYKDKIVRFEETKYYLLGDNKDCDYDKQVYLYEHNQEALHAAKSFTTIGQPGIGVLAGNVGDVYLDTTGMIDCVAWLLHNEEAAYMEHVYVPGGTGVNIEKMEVAVNAIVDKFKTETGRKPTNVVIKFDETKYNPKELPKWMNALKPKGLKVILEFNGGKLAYTVKSSGQERKIWQCEPIIFETEVMRGESKLRDLINKFQDEEVKSILPFFYKSASDAMSNIVYDYKDGLDELENAKNEIEKIIEIYKTDKFDWEKDQSYLVKLIAKHDKEGKEIEDQEGQTSQATKSKWRSEILKDFYIGKCTFNEAIEALSDIQNVK